ncbi:PepSY domain-containing protein [Sphingomonas alba]|uniref:PepSY domain-containing protein n=1 Tax=Sphingomonas alba TaxID=2908208 RepID=A0ABT0RL03_9SPHN|nr:PepSY domain-containing protein [Sphingomonas alba]MCL6683306.1 PepSY domain-containing protein [Sphingomonas alba]
MINRRRLRRWHIWLGWLVAIPMLFWTVSGVVMVLKPIEEVRGEALIRPQAPIRLAAPPVPPALEGIPFKSLSLQQRVGGPIWVVTLADGSTRLANPATGAFYSDVSGPLALLEFMKRYTGKAHALSVARVDPDRPPLELRKPVKAWLITMSDGAHFYVDASGEIIAKRTRWWRFYDFMWGLHIMDPAGREDTHNPWIITFALISVTTVILALILLPMTIRRRKAEQ